MMLRSALILFFISTLASAANSVALVSSASNLPVAAPLSAVTAYGSNLATAIASTSSSDLPTSLGGTTVSITDSGGVSRPAGIEFVSSGQVNFLIPAQTATGTATATITNSSGSVATGTIQIGTVAPGLYSANSNGKGVASAQVIQVAADGSQTPAPVFICGAVPLSCISVPIVVNTAPGTSTVLVLYGTGIRGNSSLASVNCTIGGTQVAVQYAGPQNDYPGLDQVNVLLPASLANHGEMNVILTVQGQNANTVVIATGPALNTTQNFYVAPNGNDQWSGTLAAPNSANNDGPFASPAKAQSAVRSFLGANPGQPVSVVLRQGTYYLPLSGTNPGTLNFTTADSGVANAPVTWRNYPGELPVISGGIPVTSKWNNVSGNLWQTQLPASTQPFEYLFYNGQRRLRSRVAGSSGVGYYMNNGACYSTATGQTTDLSLCNLGTFLRVAAEIPPTGDNAQCPSVTNSAGTQSKCLDRFGYNPSDPIAQWVNLNAAASTCGGAQNAYPAGDVELTLFDAWTVDVMRISCIDATEHIIYLTGPTNGNASNYNFFGPAAGHRYIIENVLDAFNAAQSAGQTGIWFVDRSTSPWTLNYLANSGENPNVDSVVVAQLAPATEQGGSLIAASGLSNVTFQGLTLEVDNYIPSSTGFNNDENGEGNLPALIDCESCQNVTFDSVVLRHTSASGLQIASAAGNSGAPASNDLVQNSAFYDIGSSGIHIGHHPLGSDKAANVVQFVTVQNNLIQGYSRVFADGEGIAQGNGHDITYLHNDITDGYHAGISICMLGCPSAGFAANGVNIVSQFNHIWNVMQGVTSDGGSLYYNIGGSGGSGTGNKILSNLVHDVTDSSILDSGVAGSGYGGHGIYLDIQSAGVDIENNVVYRVAGSTAFIHEGPALGQSPNTFRNNIFAYARLNMFEEQNPWPQGCNLVNSPQVNIQNNIFYFDRNDSNGFYVTNGCANSCSLPYNQFQSFEGNLYWRTDGQFSTYGKAFHVLTNPASGNAASSCGVPANPNNAWTFLSFSQWQNGQPMVNGSPLSTNEDAGGTTSTDPGFGNSGAAIDYQILGSPLAGFTASKTNDTILNAGRNTPVIFLLPVPATYPTYSYSQF